MRRLTYDAPPRDRLKLGEGVYVHGGHPFEVADDLAEHLLASEVPVTEITMPDPESGEGSTTTKEDHDG